MNGASRRTFLQAAGAMTLAAPAVSLFSPSARATPEMMKAAIDKVVGGAHVTKGRITIDIPPLVENGNVVPVTISVDSPMTPENHVNALHFFNEKNPQPNIISVRFSPRSGKAAVATRIRLADAQKVVAIAEMNDGTFFTASADVIVTLAACVEATL